MFDENDVFQFRPCERTSLLQLINTDNRNLNKVLTVLAALCAEMELLWLEAEERFYPAIMYYGEGGVFLFGFDVIKFVWQQLNHISYQKKLFVTRC